MPVVSATIMENHQSPNYRDILIHHPGQYSEVKVIFGHDAVLDQFEIVSFLLWGTAVPDFRGAFKSGEEYTATFNAANVKFVRMYVRSKHPSLPLPVKVWMR